MSVRLKVDGHVLDAAESLPRRKRVAERFEGNPNVKLGLGGNESLVATPHCGPNEGFEAVVRQAKQAPVHQLLGFLPIDLSNLRLWKFDSVDQSFPGAENSDHLHSSVHVQVLRRVLSLHEKLDSCSQRLDIVLAEKHEVCLDVVFALLVGSHVFLNLEGTLPDHLCRSWQNRHVPVVVGFQQLRVVLSRTSVQLWCLSPQHSAQVDFLREVLLQACQHVNHILR
mmetsp:Transcript_38469/g.69763  ORF Transcript_38469/g.69763 Transcript_38469/m.69763 type:complete len:225 (-) Transcript_38469:441-1115(-)